MNILHIVNSWAVGGIQEQVYLICKYMKQHKHFVAGFSDTNVPFYEKFVSTGATLLNSNPLYTDINKWVNKFGIDLVHKQTGGGDYPAYIDYCYENVIPVIETLHCPRRSRLPINRVRNIVYTTDYTLQQNKKEYQNIMVPIQYSLDIDHIFPRKEESEKLVIGRLCRIVPEKRWDLVVQLVDKLNAGMQDKIDFIFAGSQADSEYGKSIVSSLTKHNNVKFIGYLEDKYDLYKQIDICFNPVWETSFDIVFLEAMACGVPIITNNNSAAPYVVQKAGIICDDNIDDIVRKTELLLLDKDSRFLLGLAGHSLIQSEYDRETNLQLLSKLYESNK